jgi:hypothetical protein
MEWMFRERRCYHHHEDAIRQWIGHDAGEEGAVKVT